MKPSTLVLLLTATAGFAAAVTSYKDEGNSLKVDPISDADNVPSGQVGDGPNQDEEQNNLQSFYMSISMIVVSEIGDKTFLIAALMSMKHPRLLVFSAAFSSLAIMTVLSGIVGHALPTLISQRVTQFLAAILFAVFGVKLFREAMSMSKDAGVGEEMAEVEEELQASEMNIQMDDLEGGIDVPKSSTAARTTNEILSHINNLASFVLSPVWIQVFIMTFLGEWGDRSQIATIALAAGSDYWMVILGAVVGHGLCTAAATVGGQLLAKRISMRNVTFGGAIAFIIFSVLYFYDSYFKSQEQL